MIKFISNDILNLFEKEAIIFITFVRMVDFRIENFFWQVKMPVPSKLEFPPIIMQYQAAHILRTFH